MSRAQGGPTSGRSAKHAAARIGCTVEEYLYRVAADEYWCGLGKHWVARAEGGEGHA